MELNKELTKEEIMTKINEAEHDGAKIDMTKTDDETAVAVIKERLHAIADAYKRGDNLMVNHNPEGTPKNELIFACKSDHAIMLLGQVMASLHLPPHMVLMSAMQASMDRRHDEHE